MVVSECGGWGGLVVFVCWVCGLRSVWWLVLLLCCVDLKFGVVYWWGLFD